MLSLLSCVIYILVLYLSGINARAVDAKITSLPTSNVSSIISQNITASSQSCTDIKTCRTLEQIVVSCLATILACVWLAVHPNVPAPNVKRPHHGNILVRALKAVWRKVLDQREAVLIFGLAFLAPEWILAWAVRQALYARTLCKRLDVAREEAREERSRRDAISVDSDSTKGEIAGSDEGPWETSHAFLAIMGGFYFHNAGGPIHPLSPENVVELVRRGHLEPPTSDEISNQRQGIGLFKGVAVVQALWFVLQCIARRAKHLPITTVEVMTLAYMVMTVAMYAAWWAKPLNVSCAVRVPEEEVRGREALRLISEFGIFLMWIYVIGSQDCLMDLRRCTHVPTFWAGRADYETETRRFNLDGRSSDDDSSTEEGFENFCIADFISPLVAMVFGAVHCIAWHSEFQSQIEQQLWRSSAIT
ncbi:hypothetical protein FIBSPDRAFT_746605 [Athelia psychrophila]|uniref:Uncharacterized protein n=1 Tax=Athelia psychrophila TaxID=1759441 RepID=A0A166GBM4_9AGAM|nr:hypothetical protein FIBSPDRAFT_746605 [Fibularhizoctonia sp. CBS 109695]